MKQLLSTFILMCSFAVVYGQITLQKTYNYSTAVVKLETLGYKYYLMDVPANQVRIYNMDHSILTGLYAAENVLGKKHDVWNVNADEEYQEEVKDKA